MIKTVCFIKRKRLPNYNSIEELFGNIISEIDKHVQSITVELKNSGGSPIAMLKNILSLKTKSEVYHITGDVHYMALAFKKNTVLTIHDVNSAFYGNGFKNLYIKIFWFWLPAVFVKRITVISDFTKSELAKLIPFATDKIRVIPNPVSKALKEAPYQCNTTLPQVLLMGTKSNKNLERSIEALKTITCKVIIIGNLSEAQRQLLISNAIDFDNHFNITYEAIIAHYESADIVCFPSTYEGFGMPIIEAQAIGRPVLTSNIGAMAEVAGEGAYFVNPYDIDSIRAGVLELIENDGLRTRLIQKGLDNVGRFQTEHIAKQYLALYEELIHSS